MASYPYPVKED